MVKDILDELAQLVPFNYSLHVRQDGVFGERQGSGNWSGIMGDIVDGVSAQLTNIEY